MFVQFILNGVVELKHLNILISLKNKWNLCDFFVICCRLIFGEYSQIFCIVCTFFCSCMASLVLPVDSTANKVCLLIPLFFSSVPQLF